MCSQLPGPSLVVSSQSHLRLESPSRQVSTEIPHSPSLLQVGSLLRSHSRTRSNLRRNKTIASLLCDVTGPSFSAMAFISISATLLHHGTLVRPCPVFVVGVSFTVVVVLRIRRENQSISPMVILQNIANQVPGLLITSSSDQKFGTCRDDLVNQPQSSDCAI
ncbi:hypothetical protein Bca52824_011307 [Brassica carinata]|uniref:Uncharacterized protein n=1 Tax=Brassica carinata TaxID=52824 RepID=A0A8X7WF44_BRACI|nr:hypothetical protein Bca52824_011307 [Brassica carinata]